jgi:hypothetical protein
VTRLIGRAAIAAVLALSLAGCIDSSDPILADSQPVLGQRLKLQLYAVRDGYAHEPEQASYAWNGALYTHASGGLKDVGGFSVHPFEAGDDIVQTVPAQHGKSTEYALLHKIAEGTYLVIAIDEDDADEATRASYCKHLQGSACRIETREQLFAFARATAARQKLAGGLVVRLPDSEAKPAKRRRK